MSREIRRSSRLQATIEFPRRKTRSQRKKIDSKVEVDGSPRKRRDTAEVCRPPVSPKKKKINKGESEDVVSSDAENTLPQETKCADSTPLVSKNKLQSSQTTTPYKPLPNKNLFDVKSTPCTPKQRSVLSLAKAEGQCYSAVKKALHTGAPRNLLCREKELETIKTFLENHLEKQQPGSLYISGAPGTGKTACLTKVMDELEDELDGCPITFVNCMALQHSYAIFGKILQDFNVKGKVSGKDSQKVLEKRMTTLGPMRIVILDEVDQLETKNQEVLYTMFEWPALPKSKLILIGIANALDLTDRILPRLQARPKCKPELLHFAPYTRNQIAMILQDRISETSKDAVILDNPAIQFCARKVAAVAGDMRKALDICRRAVEVVEADVKKQQILQPVLCDKTNSPKKPATPIPPPKKVGITQIANVVSDVYGSRIMASSNGSQPTIPLQQKLLVCTLMLIMKQGKSKEVTIGKFHDMYCSVCKKQQISQVSQDDFIGLCKMLEARGILGLKKAKETRLVKVSLKIDEKEVDFALQDKTLLSTILQSYD